MFILFVGATLYITYWASKRTRSRQDYYTAGGRITGLQNGLAIAGDFISAASFLGISALVYTSGYDGLIYSIGFLIGWPIILFLIAEPAQPRPLYLCRCRLLPSAAKPIRALSACGSFGGGGAVSDRADGRRRQADPAAVRTQLPCGGDPGRHLMVLYVLFGGMLATTWVQIIRRCCCWPAPVLWR